MNLAMEELTDFLCVSQKRYCFLSNRRDRQVTLDLLLVWDDIVWNDPCVSRDICTVTGS